MAKSRKPKPSFDAPADAAGPSDTAWVYRSESDTAPSPATPTPETDSISTDAPPAVMASTEVDRQDIVSAAIESDASQADRSPATDDARTIGGRAIAERYAVYAGAAGLLLPVPAVDMAAIAGVQLAMVRALAGHYGRPFNRNRGKAIISGITGGVASAAAGRSLLKMLMRQIPVAGTVFGLATVPTVAGGVTYAIGRAFITHFERGGTLDDFDVAQARSAVADHMAASSAPA